MSLEQIITKVQETYPDLCEKDANGAKGDLCWCDRRDLLSKSRGLDSCVQFLDDTLPPLGLLGLGSWSKLKVAARGLRSVKAVRKSPRGVGRLVQTDPSCIMIQ